MNCWIWIILLWICGGNGFGGCGCNNNCCRRDDEPCKPAFPRPEPSCPSPGCGCGNDMIQPRGFAGFGDSGTCGCEENMKSSSKLSNDDNLSRVDN